MSFELIRNGETKTRVLPDGVRRSILSCDSDVTLSLMRSDALESLDSTHSHMHRQIVYILRGSGIFRIGEETREVSAGDCITIEADAPHTFIHFSEYTEWLEFFAPGRSDLAPEFVRE